MRARGNSPASERRTPRLQVWQRVPTASRRLGRGCRQVTLELCVDGVGEMSGAISSFVRTTVQQHDVIELRELGRGQNRIDGHAGLYTARDP